MKRVFISQGMNGKTDAQIATERKNLEKIVSSAIDDKKKFINSIIKDIVPRAVYENNTRVL